jgi:hypothetical protein
MVFGIVRSVVSGDKDVVVFSFFVITGLDPVIQRATHWIPGSSPGMTELGCYWTNDTVVLQQ